MDDRARMEIEWACTRLSHAFSHCINTRDYESLVQLFTPDGFWDRHGQLLRGRAQMLAAMRARPSNQFTRHMMMTAHFTEITETTAKASIIHMCYFAVGDEPLPRAYIPQNALLLDKLDTYQKTDEGWKFSERIAKFVFVPESQLHR